MSYQRLLILATACAVAAFLVLVLRVGHPHHRQLALAIYGLGWVPFVLSIFAFISAYRGQAEQALHWKIPILIGVGFVAFAWVFTVLIPAEKSPLLDLDIETGDLAENLEADLGQLAFVDHKMQDATNELLQTGLIESDQLSTSESRELHQLWGRFIESSFELDVLKTRYRAFYQVNGFVHPVLHAKAFMIGYGALVSQYRAASTVAARIGRHETAKLVLDEAQPEWGIPAGSFARVQLMVSRPDEIVRLNAGRAYLLLMKQRLEAGDLAVERTEDQLDEISRLALTDFGAFVNNPLDVLEHHASNAWFPVQKGVALGIASVRTVTRDYFISPSDLADETEHLLPGDIMLTRREWHLTNLGIPGYWTHAALFIGHVEQLDRYFSDLSSLHGKSPTAVLRDQFPQAYAALTESGDRSPSVIEALRPGVIVQPLQASATADSLAVLRPKVSKADRWQALVAALPHYGKPYNYEFDFRTESALVCSQLVYKAYEPIAGLRLSPTMSNGRLLLSPNEIAIKYDRELETPSAELDLVLFLDGMGIGKVSKRTAQEFRTSWSRPKWHIVFQ